MNKYVWATYREILLPSLGITILVHDVINVLYYEHYTDKQKYFTQIVV